MAFQDWLNSVNGKYIDVDGVYGSQCVDVILNYCKYLFPGVSTSSTIGIGNAKDLYNTASTTYFTKIANNKLDPNQLPNQGDIIVYDRTSTNPYGHIAVVISANASGVQLVQQDGFIAVDAQGNAHGTTQIVNRAWGRSPCIGWLRPKIVNVTPPTGGKDMPIPNADNYYGRYNKAMSHIRGRTMSREEFNKNFVGQTDLRMLEAMLDDAEADNYYALGQWAKANKANIEKQVKDQQAQIAAKDKLLLEIKAKADLSDSLQKKVDALTAEKQKDMETGNSFIRWIGGLFNKG